MATWPATLPEHHYAVQFAGSISHNTIRTPFESGYVATRARFIGDRRRFRVGWNGLTEAQFNTFMTFVENCNGGADSFTWTDNAQSTPVDYTMRFADNEIQWELISPEVYRLSFVLEEV